MGSHRWSSSGAAAVLLLAAVSCGSAGSPAERAEPPATSAPRSSAGPQPPDTGRDGGAPQPSASVPRPTTPDMGNPGVPAPPGGLTPDEQLAAFVRECEQSADPTTWRPGQVDYPETMTLEVGREDTYSVAVDVRATPAPPEDVIDAADPTSEPVQVQCVLSARLIPVGDHLSVAAEDQHNVVDGWSYQRFTPAGIVEWAWTVKADAPAPGRLRLVLRPAVVVSEVVTARVVSEQPYETRVEVEGSVLAELSYWFETEFPFLKALGITLGGALLGVLAWFGGVRTKWRELRARPAGEKPAGRARAPSSPRRREQGKGKKRRNGR